MFKILAVSVFCALQIYSCHGYLDTKLAAKRMNQLISSWEIQGLNEKYDLTIYPYNKILELQAKYIDHPELLYELDILFLSLMMDLDGVLDVVIDRRTTDLVDEEIVTTIVNSWNEMSVASDAVTKNVPRNCKFNITLIARAYGRQFADEFATCALVAFDAADAISDKAQGFAETCQAAYNQVFIHFEQCANNTKTSVETCMKSMSNFMHQEIFPKIEKLVNENVDNLVRAGDVIMARNRLQICGRSVVKNFKNFMSTLPQLCFVDFNKQN